jgi:S1-C subfamily serine protease
VTTTSADGAALGAALTGSPAPASTPSATSSASTSTTSSATSTPGATPAASPSPTASASSSGPTTATIKRADIDAALGDFAGTASTFTAAFTPQGLRFDAVADGSLLAKVGLQKGDVLTTIDGQPLRSLDDAANLYARLPTAHGSTLQVQRAGKPITLRIAIQ